MSEAQDAPRREACRFATVVDVLVTATFWAAIAGIPASLFTNVTWFLSLSAAGLFLATQLAWQLYLLPLRLMIRRRKREGELLRAKIERVQAETLQLQILGAQQRQEIAQKDAYISALRTEIAERERLASQRRAEMYAKELLAEQRRVELAYRRIELNQLEARAEHAEYRAAQLEIRLEQANLWRLMAGAEDRGQEKILSAYRTGYEHGKSGVSFIDLFGRHLKLVEDSA